MEKSFSSELQTATDAQIEDAVTYADPVVLRALLYQLTEDAELIDIETRRTLIGYLERPVVTNEADVALIRRKAADFLKSCRDNGVTTLELGSRERLRRSLELLRSAEISDDALIQYSEEMGFDPWSRSLKWSSKPDPERLAGFNVVVIGAGMGGLNAAMQLQRAGIPFTVLEKNKGVGGTWHENRYPGARVDTLSRMYTHTFGVDFPYPYAFCPWTENQKYFDWVADNFDVRRHIQFETEVEAITWDEKTSEWEVRYVEKGEEKVIRAKAVFTAVGFLNRARLPDIEGRDSFKGGSWHTSRWPEGVDLKDKRVAVIGTGCSGYQMIPELALEVKELTVFQRTPQWVFPYRGYRSKFPPQVNWLDRNLPFYTNFLRLGGGVDQSFIDVTTIDPDFDDPYAISAGNKRAWDVAVNFLKDKIADPKLVEAMIPPHPPWSARPVAVDPEYSVLDALQKDHVTLVTEGIRRITPTGIETTDGRQIDVDVIVYATGFHATEYLFPMTVTGRDGVTTQELWAEEGARAYRGCMIPGFPNLWTIYGPNTNAGLAAASFHEMVVYFALQCIEKLILDGKTTVEVLEEPFVEYNRLIDEGNKTKAWADPRAANYYWTKYGRSATQNPFSGQEMWSFLHYPDFDHLAIG